MSLWDKIAGNETEPKPSTHPPPVAKEAHTSTVPKKEEESVFSLTGLKHALGADSTPTPHAVPHPVAGTHTEVPASTSKQKERGWGDSFRDLLDGGAANKQQAEEERQRLEKERIEKELAAKKAEEAASWTGKLKGIFQSDEEEAAERKRLQVEAEHKRLEAEAAKHKESSWTAKIRDVFDGDNEEKEKERLRLAEEAKRNQTFGARVRGFFGEEAKAPPPKESFGDKIVHTLEGKPKEPEKERGWLADKLNTVAGGGKKSEADEDKLDKAIDLYQQHVLRKGDQHNESAVEQAKDEQISDSIRHGFKSLTGHNLPSKDKPH